MAIRTEQRTIHGFSVEVTQFPARRALEKKFQLLQVIGKPLSSLMSAVKLSSSDNIKGIETKDLLSKMDLSIIGQVIEQVMEALPPNKAVDFMLSFFICTKVNGVDLNEGYIDLNFAGDDLVVLYKIFLFVLEVNYKNFLGMSSIFH